MGFEEQEKTFNGSMADVLVDFPTSNPSILLAQARILSVSSLGLSYLDFSG